MLGEKVCVRLRRDKIVQCMYVTMFCTTTVCRGVMRIGIRSLVMTSLLLINKRCWREIL